MWPRSLAADGGGPHDQITSWRFSRLGARNTGIIPGAWWNKSSFFLKPATEKTCIWGHGAGAAEVVEQSDVKGAFVLKGGEGRFEVMRDI